MLLGVAPSSSRSSSDSPDPTSPDQAFGGEGDTTLGDLIPHAPAAVLFDAAAATLLHEQIHQVLGGLTDREADIVPLRFGLTDGRPRTLDEIGHTCGVTRKRIRQIEQKTMTKLRHPARARLLRDYLASADIRGQRSAERFNGVEALYKDLLPRRASARRRPWQ